MLAEEALRRRRTCRHFSDEPVDRALLDTLADAAHSAPTASNVAYRHVMIVDDPRVVEAVRVISPSLQSRPPALIVVLTDLELAIARIGPIGASASLIDSGAAGENVWLAATALGLGTQFTMISTMPGIRRVLDLPERFRVDLIMPVGHPRAGAARASGPRRSRPTHRNQFEHHA
jgi:nitroreductase